MLTCILKNLEIFTGSAICRWPKKKTRGLQRKTLAEAT
jgi:hypothetical protein